ncbi:hypothetical protein HAX54_050413 [Datura stramonium]|uniref:Uncharacterized protein n=1 Tax=Datura stramonium TaxID=4076 RepID=A0ABS8RQV6_DATST|nr:hypothetical protein [Datura stramonium]
MLRVLEYVSCAEGPGDEYTSMTLSEKGAEAGRPGTLGTAPRQPARRYSRVSRP